MVESNFLKPRVCYVLPEYNLATGSHFFYLYELLERAVQNLDLLVIIEKSNIPLRDIRFPAYLQKFRFPPLRALELFFVLLRERIRGTTSFYVHYSFFGALVAWLVTAFLGGRVFYWNCGMPWLYKRGWLEEAIFRFILRHIFLVTGTEGIKAQYKRHYQLVLKRIFVLPNWINCVRWSAPRENSIIKWAHNIVRKEHGIVGGGKKVVLFVHRLSRRKGSHWIPAVVSSVLKKYSNVVFIIVGDGPDGKKLEAEIVNLGLSSNVILLGIEKNADLPHYFAAADVFFMPSEEEGFPHVLLEALATGVPYVASDVGGVKEITPPELQEFVVPSGNTEMFARKIVHLLSINPEEYGRIVKAEQRWVKKYDIDAVLPKFVALFS